MQNNSSKLVKTTAKLFVALLAVCMVLTALPLLSPAALPEAKAEAVTYQVPAGTTADTITAQLATYAAGTEVNVLLQGNVDFTSKNPDSNDETFGIIIPAGITVNLYMNGKSIKYERHSKDEGADWQQKGIFAIVNNGNLNIYSGNPTRPDLASGNATISVVNQRTGMSISEDEKAYSRVDAIVNAGNLTVNKAVKIQVTNYLGYEDITFWDTEHRGATTVATTGIYNTSSNAVCTVNDANIDVLAQAYAIVRANKDEVTMGRAFGYGIYGGAIEVNGNSNIHVNSYARAGCTDSPAGNKQKGGLISVAYDICSADSISINGGTFSYETSHECNQAVTDKGSSWSYEGAVCYSGAAPMITDATITSPSGTTGIRGSSKTYNEATVTKMSVLPYSGYALFHNDSTPGTTYNGIWDTYNEPSYPTGTVEAGKFTDEAGNVYTVTMDTTDDATHPDPITRGGSSGNARVHIVYRYWTNNNKAELVTSIVGTNGNAGYSTDINDGTNIVANELILNGVSGNGLMKPKANALSYASGGEPKNEYYWKQFNLAYKTTSDWFSNFDVTSTASNIIFKSFTGTTNNTVGAGIDAPIYVFADYYKISPTSIAASVGTGNRATATYTGEPIKASDIGLKISEKINNTNYTADYNIDCADGVNTIPVIFEWSGTNKAGVAESGSGVLPTNAGTYTVTMTIADDTVFNPNDCDPNLHKNRNGLTYEFTLEIEQAPVVCDNVSTPVSLTYGERLSSKIDFASCTVKGVKNEDVSGSFSFETPTDGSGYKNVGSASVNVLFTPSYPDGASVKNYRNTVFSVPYTVSPATLTIAPKAASVVYGSDVFNTPFGVTADGLVANDNNENVKSVIAEAVNYMILVNSSYVVYAPGETNVGSYPIRARISDSDMPEVLNNYTVVYADTIAGTEVNVLTVTKCGLTVQASAVSREYAPDNFSVNVTYTVTAGKQGVDDVRFTTGTGALSVNSAGTREVSGVTKASALAQIAGAAASNYTVAELTYNTGDTLTVEITKAVPVVNNPTTTDVYYKRNATLKDITLSSGTSSVPGEWKWANENINPTVAVSSYTATFVPDDSVNYESKTVSVNLNVLPSTVNVTYNGTVEYGDPVPNITAYTYSSVQDTDFNINAVTTSGNITPSTTYTLGSRVTEDGYPVTIYAPNYIDVAGNYNFNVTEGKITVIPRNIEFTVENVSIEYATNYAASSAAVTADESRLVGDDTLTDITEDGSAPTFFNSTEYSWQTSSVGKYNITASPLFHTSPNYTVSVKNGTLTVTKAPLTIKADSFTLEYNSDVPANIAAAFKFVGAKKNDTAGQIITSGSVTVETAYTKGSPVNAEGYPVMVNISGAEFKNYTVTVENGSINVIKATPVISVYPTASIVHGQTLADAVFTGAAVNDDVPGTFVFNSSAAAPLYSATPYTNYNASFIPADTANYNVVPITGISLTVNKKPISGALAVNGIPMVGETLNADLSGLDPSEPAVYTVTWKDGETVLAIGSSLTLDETHVGKVITVEAVANNYYTGSVSCETTQIAPELPDISGILNADYYDEYFTLTGLDEFGGETSVEYDGREHLVSLKQKLSTLSTTVIGAITVKYNGSSAAPVNAGVYNVTVDIATPDLGKVSDASITTYSPTSNFAIGTLTVTPAVYSVTVTAANKVYDGYNTASAANVQESGAVTLTGGTKDDVSFNAAKAVYVFADANVGSGKTVTASALSLTGASKDNYTLDFSLANEGKANITPRTLKVRVEPVAREYQENNYDVDLSFVVDVSTIAPADTSSSVYVNESLAKGTVEDYHAGSQRVTVSEVELTGAKAANYTLEITNINDVIVTIEKAIPSYPLPSTGVVYYDSGRNLSNISLGDSRWKWAESVANVVPGAGSHTYAAVYTPDDTDNFAEVEYEVAFDVRKAPVVVKSANFTALYGEAEPTYYYTLTGLTGADTKDVLGGYVIQDCAYRPGSDVQDYSIVFRGEFTSANYSFTYVPGTLKVTPRPVYVTVIPESRAYEKDNLNVTVNFSALDNVYAGDASYVYLAAASVEGTLDKDSAGTRTVTYELPALDGAKAIDYELKAYNPKAEVVISKAVLDGIVLPKSGTVEYGKRLSETRFTGDYTANDKGTFSMKNPSSTPAAVGLTSDVYEVVFTPYDSLNYAAITDYISLNVLAAELNLNMSIAGSIEPQKVIEAVPSNLSAEAANYVVYRWYVVDSATDTPASGELRQSGKSRQFTIDSRDVGKYIICQAGNDSDSPFIISGETRTSEAVKEGNLSFWQRLVKWFYRLIASITQLFGGLLG